MPQLFCAWHSNFSQAAQGSLLLGLLLDCQLILSSSDPEGLGEPENSVSRILDSQWL